MTARPEQTSARRRTAPGAGPAPSAPGSWTSPSRAVRPLAWLVLALCVVGPVVRVAVDAVRDRPSLPQSWLAEAARLVNLDAEGNLPTYVSTMLLVGVAAGLGTAAVLVRARGGRAWPLGLPAAVAAFLSVDELASLHEQLALLADLVGAGGGLVFTWVVPGALLALAVGAALLVAARRLSRQLRVRLVVAGVVYLLGAVVLEAASSPLFTPTPEGLAEAPAQSVPYVLVNTLEEGLEMVGALLALRAALSLLRLSTGRAGLLVDLDPAVPAVR